MYNVERNHPLSWWKTLITGWYIPACWAIAWITSTLWMPKHHAITAGGIPTLTYHTAPVRTGLVLSLLLNTVLFLGLHPRVHRWLIGAWVLGFTLATIIYPVLDALVGLSTRYHWVIPAPATQFNQYAYWVTPTSMIAGHLVVSSLMLALYWGQRYPRQARQRVVGAWLALWIVTTALVSPRVRVPPPPPSPELPVMGLVEPTPTAMIAWIRSQRGCIVSL